MTRFRQITKTVFRIAVYFFAAIGVFLMAGYFAVRMGWTNVQGTIDPNNRYFTSVKNDTRASLATTESSTAPFPELPLWCKIFALQKNDPANAGDVLSTYHDTNSYALATGMINAIAERLPAISPIRTAFDQCDTEWKNISPASDASAASGTASIYPWINTPEWITLSAAILKDAPVINQVATETGIEPRLIVAQLVGEQLRLYNTERELYKSAFAPLNILGSETQFSLGVAGIKPDTAIAVEQNLQNTDSDYYPGAAYAHLLDFTTTNHDTERYDRITDEHNHYYSYLYAALFLKEVEAQWAKAGIDISHRPEILSTLYNIGFSGSHPNANPQVGGSTITIGGTDYTFGSLGYEFYYSGEMADAFPYWK